MKIKADPEVEKLIADLKHALNVLEAKYFIGEQTQQKTYPPYVKKKSL